MDTLLFSCKSILNLVKNAVDGYRMIIDHRQTCDLSSLFYFMQIEISASSRNPTCEIILVFLALMCVFPPFSCLSALVDTLHLRCAPRRCFCSSDCTEMPVCLSSCDGLGCAALCTFLLLHAVRPTLNEPALCTCPAAVLSCALLPPL